MSSTSIRGRLLRTLAASLLLLWLCVVSAVALVVLHETDEIFDSGLQETAQRLLSLAMRDAGSLVARTGRAVPEIMEHDEYLVYQVFDAQRNLLLRSHRAPGTLMPVEPVRGLRHIGGQHLFVEGSQDGRFFIVVAEPEGHRSETAESVLLYLLVPLLALVPLAALAVSWSVRHAQRPIEALEREIAARGQGNFDALDDTAPPIELRGIAGSVNLLLRRLQAALEAERHFSANCAHELRTPLAAAMAQLQVVGRGVTDDEQRRRLASASAMLARLNAVTERILHLARLEAGIAFGAESVDLVMLAGMMLRDCGLPARREVVFEHPDAPVEVIGDPDAIGIAIQNLLANAERHSPPGTPVRVCVLPDAILYVENDADRVPEHLMAQLGQRFVRAARERSGSGLGLAIVATIARQSGGRLNLESPVDRSDRGFRATLALRPSESLAARSEGRASVKASARP